jgi:hypothetical protein
MVLPKMLTRQNALMNLWYTTVRKSGMMASNFAADWKLVTAKQLLAKEGEFSNFY